MVGADDMDESAAIRLQASVDKLTSTIESLQRTLTGSPEEGNAGVLYRLLNLEKRVERLYWTFPFLVVGGTALGNVLAKWLGI